MSPLSSVGPLPNALDSPTCFSKEEEEEVSFICKMELDGARSVKEDLLGEEAIFDYLLPTLRLFNQLAHLRIKKFFVGSNYCVVALLSSSKVHPFLLLLLLPSSFSSVAVSSSFHIHIHRTKHNG